MATMQPRRSVSATRVSMWQGFAPASLLLTMLTPLFPFDGAAALPSSLAGRLIAQAAPPQAAPDNPSLNQATPSASTSENQSAARTAAGGDSDRTAEITLHALTPKLDCSQSTIAAAQSEAQRLSEEEMIRKGVQLTINRRWDDAVKVFQEVLAEDPANADAYYNLGAISEDRGCLEEALRFYRAGHELRPDDRELAKAVADLQKSSAADVTQDPGQPVRQANGPQDYAAANDLNLAGWKKLMKTEHHRQIRSRILGTLALALIIGGCIALSIH